MQREQIIAEIVEHLQACVDESLLDLIHKLLLESGY